MSLPYFGASETLLFCRVWLSEDCSSSILSQHTSRKGDLAKHSALCQVPDLISLQIVVEASSHFTWG